VSSYGRAVLVPVSLEPEKHLLLRAFRMLGWGDAEYTLFHVVEVPITTAPYANDLAGILGEVRKRLEPLADWLRGQGYKVEVKVVAARDVVDGIIEEIEESPYLLILLHKKRRKKIEKLLLAFTKSTSQRLIQRASIPVMVIPVEEHP